MKKIAALLKTIFVSNPRTTVAGSIPLVVVTIAKVVGITLPTEIVEIVVSATVAVVAALAKDAKSSTPVPTETPQTPEPKTSNN